MDKQKKLMMAFPVLLVIAAIVWGPIFMGRGGEGKGAPIPRDTAGAQISGDDSNVSLAALARSHQRNMSRTVYDGWARNPFVLAQDPNDLSVEGIVWDEKNPKAIISGKIYAVGDLIGVNRIMSIGQRSVVIQSGTEAVELRLGTEP